MTMRDNEMTTSGATSDKITSGTTSDNEWQRVTTTDNECLFWIIFLFCFGIKEEPAIMHPKETL